MHTRLLSRRQSLQLLGAGASASYAPLIFSASTAATGDVCRLAPELTVGPYYVNKQLVRDKLVEGKSGVPLRLRISVLNANTCQPIRNAAVDVWQCDARGYYSGYTANDPDQDLVGPGGGPDREGGPGRQGGPREGGPGRDGGAGRDGGPGAAPGGGGDFAMPATDELTFLRGVQVSNARGVAEFRSIYPGWYYSRATHIHLKVHIAGQVADRRHSGGHVCHVGQLFFSDELNDRVAATMAYQNRKLVRTRNSEDSIFAADIAGSGMLVTRQLRRADLTRGLIADAVVVVNPDSTPAPVMQGGPARLPA